MLLASMTIRNLLIVIGPVVLLAGCGAGSSARDGVDQVGTGLPGALQAPLEDLNLRREEIPEVLVQARTDPYSTRDTANCRQLRAEIARLDEVLGPDGAVSDDNDTSRADQASEAAAGATLDAVRGTVTDFIPARSWVRRLTGAHQHSQEVQAAIRAGEQRRGFLKGISNQKGCRS